MITLRNDLNQTTVDIDCEIGDVINRLFVIHNTLNQLCPAGKHIDKSGLAGEHGPQDGFRIARYKPLDRRPFCEYLIEET